MTLTMEILFTVILAIASAFGYVQATPMTEHAREAHADQATNAASMLDTVEAELNGDGPCDVLQVHICRQHNGVKRPHAKIACIENGRSTAELLIIGLADGEPKVVTGYRCRKSYLVKSVWRDQCVVVDVNMLRYWMRLMFPGVLQ